MRVAQVPAGLGVEQEAEAGQLATAGDRDDPLDLPEGVGGGERGKTRKNEVFFNLVTFVVTVEWRKGGSGSWTPKTGDALYMDIVHEHDNL